MRRLSRDDDRALKHVKHRQCHTQKPLKTLEIVNLCRNKSVNPTHLTGNFRPRRGGGLLLPLAGRITTRQKPFPFRELPGIVCFEQWFRSKRRCDNGWLETARPFG